MNFNALIEFLILSGGAFFIFMFLGYRDALRSKKPIGPLAALLNNFNGWEYEDEKGIRGILFRQPFWVKLIVAIIAAALIRIAFDFFFDFKTADGRWAIFTGYTGWLLMAVVIYFGMFMSYLWPNVKNKIVDIKDDALKKGNEAIEESQAGLEKAREQAEQVKEPKKAETKVEPETKDEPDHAGNEKGDNPDDIINDYLK